MPEVVAYAVESATAPFTKTTITRRDPGPHEVLIDIKFAGICHSDIHTARQEWGAVNYPLVPGHEIAGVVAAVGSEVSKFQVGDRAGVGCMVDSCRECEYCRRGDEQYCQGRGGVVWTYGAIGRDGLPTAGGYSQAITVQEDFVCRIPETIDLAHAAPLLCAGITLYSPLTHWQIGEGSKVAIIGMGGLGHVGVQIADALGAEVTVLSHSMDKDHDAKRFGAEHYFATSEEGTFRQLRSSFDLMINTVSANLDLAEYLALLKIDGTLVNLGLPEHPASFSLRPLVLGRRRLAGSDIGGIAATQAMLDFCAEHTIAPQIEIITGADITAAYERVIGSDARYRFVIDTATFAE